MTMDSEVPVAETNNESAKPDNVAETTDEGAAQPADTTNTADKGSVDIEEVKFKDSDNTKTGKVEEKVKDEDNERSPFIPDVDTQIGEPRPWKSRLFKFTCKQCILSLCCLPCQAARVGRRLNESCGCFVACAFLGAVRAKFRGQHNIRGNICSDGYLSWFCTPCVLGQLEREMDELGV